MVWLEDWAKRIPIEIDSTKVDEDLIDFPVLITVTGTEVFDALTASGGADSYDVLFMDSRGDQSSAAATIRFGNPSADTSGPLFYTVSGIKCLKFDASDDVLYCDNNTAYTMNTEDFTVEAWINPISLSSAYRILAIGAVELNNGDWAFGIGTGGSWGTGIRIVLSLRSSGTIYDLSSNDITSYISNGTWNHVAIVRSAGTLFFYLNGIQRGSIACNYNLSTSSALFLGCRSNGSTYIERFNGYITKWRLSKSIARYTDTFTPPTSYVDDSYTKFMYMAECDISPAEQVVGSWAQPNLSRVSTPFNRNAAWDSGTGSNDYFYISNNSYLDFGSNDFTVDGWAYIRSYDGQGRCILSKRLVYTVYKGIVLSVNASGYMEFSATNNGTTWGIFFTGPYVPINTWFHFAVVRTGSTFDLYYNGVKTNTGTMSGAINYDAGNLNIGMAAQDGYGDWYGYIYGLRLSKGIARYSDNFVPGDPLEFNSSFTNRKKIAITDANNNQLYVEIERWDHANKKAWIWTKVPTVASGTNTQLYFYYDKNKSDNTNYIGDTASIPAQSVWNSGFLGVWHLSSGSNTSGSIKDSTINARHLSGGMPTSNFISAKIANGMDLERDSSQWISIPVGASLKDKLYATHEAIIKLESHPGTSYYYTPCYESTSVSANTRFAMYVNGISASSSRASVYFRDTTTGDAGTPLSIIDTFDLSIATHYYLAATVNTTTDEMKLFRDSIRVGINTSTKTAFSSTTPALMTIGYNGAQYFDGIVEELRISAVERSEAWIKATYYSNWNDLLFFSPAEEPPYFYYEGYVNVLGIPSARKVHLHRRSTGQCVDSTTSSGTTGYFRLQSRYPDYHYVVILPELEEDYAPLFDDKIHPEI